MASSEFWLQAPGRLAQDRRVLIALALGYLLLYLPGLGSYGLYDPWETHYGEVARNMVEHDNYIDPWWGSPWDPDGVKREREGFYSKPLLIMWMMSAGMNVAGYSPLGVRFFFPLIMILALMAVYLAVSRFKNRRAGVLAALVVGTAPTAVFLSRQAVPDGPMVAIMTAGMMMLAIGLFHVKEDEEASPALYWTTLALLLIVSVGQLWAMLPMDRSPDVVRAYPGTGNFLFRAQWWLRECFDVGRGKGWVIALVLAPVVAWAAARVARQKRRRMLYIYLFYIACGLCVPAKGWLAWAPMGGAIVGYLAVTGEWKTLQWVDVPTGLLIVFVSGHPWIIAMLGGHHPEWYKRFWVHDHYNRLFAGVHKIDDGGFEYFFRWIGYGLFPWIGLLPGAIASVLGGIRKKPEAGYTPLQKFTMLIFLWALFGFFLFSKSSTKFHHYIFPIIPALGILIALFIEDVLQGLGRNKTVLIAAAVAITFWVGQDMYRMPAAYGQGSQNLVNLFTYKYDREWPKYSTAEALEKLSGDEREDADSDNEFLTGFRNELGGMSMLAGAGLLLMMLFGGWKRRYGAAVLSLTGVWCAYWALNGYLPKVAVHWSQQDMWDTYYDQCSKFDGPDAEYRAHMLETTMRVPDKPDMFPRALCREPVVAFRTNWRGETYHSANTVIPCPEVKHFEPFLKAWGNEKPFYLFTEASRVKSELLPALPPHLKKAFTQVFGRNKKFVLLRFDPPADGAGAREPASKREGPEPEPLAPSE